jgi:ketosteroid isomerase-like protein
MIEGKLHSYSKIAALLFVATLAVSHRSAGASDGPCPPHVHHLLAKSQGQLEAVLTHESSIMGYYNDIDTGDLNAVANLFGDNAVYQRGNTFTLVGKDAIKDFYNNVRALEGKHKILKFHRKGEDIVVDGVFRGTHKGTSIELKFKDYWTFGADGKVIRRRSVLEIDGV